MYPAGVRCWHVWQNAVNYRFDCVIVVPRRYTSTQSWLSNIGVCKEDDEYAPTDRLIQSMPVY